MGAHTDTRICGHMDRPFIFHHKIKDTPSIFLPLWQELAKIKKENIWEIVRLEASSVEGGGELSTQMLLEYWSGT